MTIDPDGAAIHEALDPLYAGRLQQMPGAIQIDRLEELVTFAALPHRHGQMEHMGDSLHGPAAELRVGDAAREHLRTGPGQQFGVGLLLGTIGQAEGHHLGSPPPTLLRQV
jgi:hypothetical protein